ncbi:hypothetical protein BGZ57DRAFT_448975 [Hyaloscypha finlandica]|nr:hypothetical protein F5882DRAFT_495205 [Hyaloscypha sp. PMI_1271]KAH8793136.1 hypothetical protein BGZ57DRAFT_448975 [Hyaloscypha finlandica]
MLDLGRASGPSGHVYGLMGMFQPDLSKLVAPNYDASVSDVFQDFALSVIDVSGQLDIIYHGRKGNELEKSDMPSRVPDWSQEPKDYITILDPVFQAAGTSKPVREGSEKKNLLKWRGFVVNSIDGYGCNSSWGKSDIHDVAQPLTLLQPYKSPEETKDTLLNAILGGRGRDEYDMEEETYKLLVNFPWLSLYFLTDVLKTLSSGCWTNFNSAIEPLNSQDRRSRLNSRP